uniref:Uncharacterized protein n=1 Tax=Oryza barthii TaxID=65489 RepID=A0A0D3G4C7_9ORYZ
MAAMVIFFTALLLLASSSSCLARARMMMMPGDHAVNGKETSASSKEATSPHDLLQGVAPPLPPSPPATEIICPDSSGWMPQGSVPSPGIGHRA